MLIAFALSISCGGSRTPTASPCTLPVAVDVAATDRVNPDEQGAPLPTVVKVFQLTHSARAESADFVQLWERADVTIGDQLVQKLELTVFPGKTNRLPVELDPKSRYLVGMAVFRQPTGMQWRTIVPLPASEALCAAYKDKTPVPAVTLTLDGYRIEARSHLLRADGVDLPSDVTAGSERPQREPTSAPRVSDAPKNQTGM